MDRLINALKPILKDRTVIVALIGLITAIITGFFTYYSSETNAKHVEIQATAEAKETAEAGAASPVPTTESSTAEAKGTAEAGAASPVPTIETSTPATDTSILAPDTPDTSISPTDGFNIAIGDTISDNSPEPGAGNLETRGEEDVYYFTATSGQRVYFQRLEDNHSYWKWALTSETNEVIFRTLFNQDARFYELNTGGQYKLTITNKDVNATGKYSFKIWDVPPDKEFTIAIGDTIEDGVPAEGAGYIDIPGEQDIFYFTADSRQKVYFNAISNEHGYLSWSLVDSDGLKIFDQHMRLKVNVIELRKGGQYKLTINSGRGGAVNPVVGPYSFRLENP